MISRPHQSPSQFAEWLHLIGHILVRLIKKASVERGVLLLAVKINCLNIVHVNEGCEIVNNTCDVLSGIVTTCVLS